MIALIDGDIILHRCAGSCEPTKAKPFVETSDVAFYRMRDLVSRILQETNADTFKIFVGDGKTFRHTLYPEYKSNRIKPRPTHYEFLKEILFSDYNAELVTEIETDDRLGIEQTKEGDSSIICSIDKDLLQIPGYHYNFIRQYRTFVSVSDGLRTFYGQILSGDGTDNIPGFDGKCRNTIPQFIQKLIDPINDLYDEWEMFDYVFNFYCPPEDGDWEQGFKTLLRNAKLLYIHKKENDEWQPPKQNQNIMNGLMPDITPLLSVSSDKELDDIPPNTNV